MTCKIIPFPIDHPDTPQYVRLRRVAINLDNSADQSTDLAAALKPRHAARRYRAMSDALMVRDLERSLEEENG